MYDLKVDRKYQMILNISLCLESSGPCVLETVVFKNSLLPKKPCSLITGFVQKSMLFLNQTETFQTVFLIARRKHIPYSLQIHMN